MKAWKRERLSKVTLAIKNSVLQPWLGWGYRLLHKMDDSSLLHSAVSVSSYLQSVLMLKSDYIQKNLADKDAGP